MTVNDCRIYTENEFKIKILKAFWGLIPLIAVVARTDGTVLKGFCLQLLFIQKIETQHQIIKTDQMAD